MSSFFGLRPEDKEYFLTEIYEITTKCEVPYESAWRMPIALRRWWILRKQKEQDQQRQNEETKNKGKPPPPGVIPGMKK